MKRIQSVIARTLILALVLGMVPVAQNIDSDAAAKVKLSSKKLTLKAKGKSKKLSVKKAKKYKVSWKVKNKKIAKIKKSGKYAVKVTGKKKGKTTITCTLKKGKKKKKLTCKVTVKSSKTIKTTPAPTSGTGKTPAPTPTSTPTSTPLPTPTVTPTPNPPATPTPDNLPSIKQTYSGIFDNIGMCLAYNQTWNNRKDMQEKDTMEFVDKHFNSFTLENEMKPEAILGRQNVTPITVAEAKEQGYVIGDNYKEATVPKLNFGNIDAALKIAKEHGIRMRAHTLMWHQQTPTWFFKEGYQANGETVNQATMNARLEYFVRTVVRHVLDKEIELTGEAGSLVYAWDVVNEYVHRSNAATNPTWTSVYGDLGLKPTYVKAAFQYAYDELKKKNIQDKVTLFYNDYDTYFSVEDEIALVNYINEGEEAKICAGIGMQSHVDVSRPTLEEYGAALDAFLATGLEVQITELDITINFDTDDSNGRVPSYNYKNEGQTNEDQAAFTKDFMKMIVEKQKNRDKSVSPKGITGITIWGIHDGNSWRKDCKPLFFTRVRKKNPETGKYYYVLEAKPSFDALIAAAKE